MSGSTGNDPAAPCQMLLHVRAKKVALETAREDWFLPLIFETIVVDRKAPVQDRQFKTAGSIPLSRLHQAKVHQLLAVPFKGNRIVPVKGFDRKA